MSRKVGSISWIKLDPNPVTFAISGVILEPAWVPKTYIGLAATANDDPSLNGFVDANFLRSRLASYVRGIHTYVAGRHPGVWFELLWPLDVNLPETKRLNWYVNLPPAWIQKTGSEFASFVCEGFQFGGIDRNVDEVARCAAYPFAELKWSSSDCGYLMGLFNPGWPWEHDQICLYGRGVPLPSESRTSTLTDGSE